MFIIKDWAGNVMFGGTTFETFEEAWEFIYENVPDDESLQEYYVDEKEQP